ncbi:MAG: hypothetical protein E6Y86_06235, partial [Slackia sp.]|nr:hypothetical protein [Slackia sp.]
MALLKEQAWKRALAVLLALCLALAPSQWNVAFASEPDASENIPIAQQDAVSADAAGGDSAESAVEANGAGSSEETVLEPGPSASEDVSAEQQAPSPSDVSKDEPAQSASAAPSAEADDAPASEEGADSLSPVEPEEATYTKQFDSSLGSVTLELKTS